LTTGGAEIESVSSGSPPPGYSGGSDLEAVLREMIEASQLTLQEIARRSGLTPGQLSRFVRSERTLTLTNATKVAEALGGMLVYTQAPAGPASPPPSRPSKRR
jgi:transcriptional regulator with XRE-family HTH domain